MTTIITKNGSGAPTAGQLSEGELAVDSTNKELYTKSGSTVIKIGGTGGGETGTFTDLTATSSFTSPGIDDNANATAITIDASENVGIGRSTPSEKLDVMTAENADLGPISIALGGPSTNNRRCLWTKDTTTRDMSFYAAAGSSTSNTVFYRNATDESMRIDGSGNVGIGTDSPISLGSGYTNVDIRATTGGGLTLGDTSGEHGYLFSSSAELTLQAQGARDLKFMTNATERLRIDDSGNVGIGTSSPLAKLDVSDASGPPAIYISNREQKSWTPGTELGRLSYYVGDVSGGGQRDAGGMRAINEGSAAGPNCALSFFISQPYVAPVEAMRIDSLGNVGIGEPNPSFPLEVNGGTGDGIKILAGNSNNDDSFLVHNSSDQPLFKINGAGNVSIGTSSATLSSAARDLIVGNLSGNHGMTIVSSPSHSGSIHFAKAFETGSNSYRGVINYGHNTDEMKFYTAATVRALIDSSGNFLVGTSTTIGTGTEGVQIAPNLIITGRNQTSDQTHHVFKNPNGTVGRIRTLNNATDYVTSSDERLKENIVDAPAGNIDSIKVRSFDWKADGEHQDYGFIAQELETVAPYAVSKGETENDMWGVDYSKLVPMLVKEIQDLKAEVAALKGA